MTLHTYKFLHILAKALYNIKAQESYLDNIRNLSSVRHNTYHVDIIMYSSLYVIG